MRRCTTAACLLAALALGSCRGGTSTKPPVHLVLDMDFQPKLKTQAASHFEAWSDGRAMRLPVVGTVARGALDQDPLRRNRDAGGSFVTSNPVPASLAVLERGRLQFDVHCAICHGYSGRGGNGVEGHGMVGRRWPVAVPNFHAVEGKDNRVANLVDGEYFEVITNGKGTMPAYGARIVPDDRWAIVHYIRALQNLGKQ